ncbi:MAG: hypothetical protein ACRDP5_10760 [Streptosporangiaceae bacterium]
MIGAYALAGAVAGLARVIGMVNGPAPSAGYAQGGLGSLAGVGAGIPQPFGYGGGQMAQAAGGGKTVIVNFNGTQ